MDEDVALGRCSAVVMTFNLRRPSLLDRNNGWKLRKSRAAEAILAARPDFIGTQEGSRAMLIDLTNRLPSFAWLGEGRRGGDRDETNAILYREDRWTPEQSGTFWLSETPEVPGSKSWGAVFPRICTWALFRSLDEREARLAVFNAHLDHVSRLARLRGAALAATRLLALSRARGVSAVLTGDFNAGYRSGSFAQLTLPPFGLTDALETGLPGGAAAAGATYHRFRGTERGEAIDGILATADCSVEAVWIDREKYGGGYPSDHYPVRARLSWPMRRQPGGGIPG